LGDGVAELGIRPSAFVDVGALWEVDFDEDTDITDIEFIGTPGGAGFIQTQEFAGDSPSPRVSVGIGASWNSPFGPFRFDLARAIVSEPGDDEQLFQFNVGTSF
ncbi:MAG: BamA/TamA family outer membrane protein, partial [Pseudomonadota bacterium]